MPDSRYRYTYLGGRGTRPDLLGVQCDPIRRDTDGKCIVGKLGSMLVRTAGGETHVVLRRRLRVNRVGEAAPATNPLEPSARAR